MLIVRNGIESEVKKTLLSAPTKSNKTILRAMGGDWKKIAKESKGEAIAGSSDEGKGRFGEAWSQDCARYGTAGREE